MDMIDELIASHRQINLSKLLKVMTLCNHRAGIKDLLEVISSYKGKDEEVSNSHMIYSCFQLYYYD